MLEHIAPFIQKFKYFTSEYFLPHFGVVESKDYITKETLPNYAYNAYYNIVLLPM